MREETKVKFAGITLITGNVPALAEFYGKVLNVATDGNDVHAELK
jgi:hypothetical protein